MGPLLTFPGLGSVASDGLGADTALSANRASYADPWITATYVESPYHTLRRRVAVRLLQEALDEPATPPGGVIEIGTGAWPVPDHRGLRTDAGRSALELRRRPGRRGTLVVVAHDGPNVSRAGRISSGSGYSAMTLVRFCGH